MQLRTKQPRGRQQAPQQIDLFAEKPAERDWQHAGLVPATDDANQ